MARILYSVREPPVPHGRDWSNATLNWQHLLFIELIEFDLDMFLVAYVDNSNRVMVCATNIIQ